jgi:hypothetical protein
MVKSLVTAIREMVLTAMKTTDRATPWIPGRIRMKNQAKARMLIGPARHASRSCRGGQAGCSIPASSFSGTGRDLQDYVQRPAIGLAVRPPRAPQAGQRAA